MSNVLPVCSMHNGIIPMQESDGLEIQAQKRVFTLPTQSKVSSLLVHADQIVNMGNIASP